MKKILTTLVVLFAVNLSAEIMHLKIIRPIEEKRTDNVEITLTSINKQTKVFMLSCYDITSPLRRIILTSGKPSVSDDSINVGYSKNAGWNMKPEIFSERAQNFMPLGLKVKDFFDSDRHTYLKWMNMDLLRNFLIKGLDENGFELKSTNHYIGENFLDRDISITNFWFQK